MSGGSHLLLYIHLGAIQSVVWYTLSMPTHINTCGSLAYPPSKSVRPICYVQVRQACSRLSLWPSDGCVASSRLATYCFQWAPPRRNPRTLARSQTRSAAFCLTVEKTGPPHPTATNPPHSKGRRTILRCVCTRTAARNEWGNR